MGEETNISWCDRTWSPWYGCTQISMGERGACVGCYARQISEIRMGRVVFGGPGRGIGTRDARADSAWKDPIRWNKTSPGDFVFPSMCDPFDNHPDLTDLRRRFFDLIRATPNLTWLLLTKRPQNILSLFDTDEGGLEDETYLRRVWPSNAAIGCTVVTQAEGDRDIPHLLAAKAALKPAFAFVSMEPLLGPVDLRKVRIPTPQGYSDDEAWAQDTLTGRISPVLEVGAGVWELDGGGKYGPKLDWVIAGGETDQGAHKARPSHPDWFRSLRDQCAAAGVPFHFKQWGEYLPCVTEDDGERLVCLPDGGDSPAFDSEARRPLLTAHGREFWRVGKKAAGNLLDGVLHDARPEARN